MSKKIDLNYVPPVNLPKSPPPARGKKPGQSFQEVLDKTTREISFSSHARERMEKRNITLGAEEMEKINDALDLAGQKGARDALLVCEEMALVASVKNRTVVTAVDQESMKDRVFTNIDSAVIIK